MAHAGLGEGKDRKEIKLPSGCYEEQQSLNMRPGAGRKDVKRKGREKEKKENEG